MNPPGSTAPRRRGVAGTAPQGIAAYRTRLSPGDTVMVSGVPVTSAETTNPGSPAMLVNRGSFAEGKRFELLVRGYRTLVFKTSSFGRSDNLP